MVLEMTGGGRLIRAAQHSVIGTVGISPNTAFSFLRAYGAESRTP